MREPRENRPARNSTADSPFGDEFEALAANCNATTSSERAKLLGAIVRVFVHAQTRESRLGEFITALAAGAYPVLIEELRRVAIAESQSLRADIPDQWGSPAKVTWDQAEGKLLATATLSRLPSDMKLAEDFPEPFRHNSTAQQLQYRGYMSKNSYDFLRSLHRDADYQRSLEMLYRESSRAWMNQPKKRGLGLLLKKCLDLLRGR